MVNGQNQFDGESYQEDNIDRGETKFEKIGDIEFVAKDPVDTTVKGFSVALSSESTTRGVKVSCFITSSSCLHCRLHIHLPQSQ